MCLPSAGLAAALRQPSCVRYSQGRSEMCENVFVSTASSAKLLTFVECVHGGSHFCLLDARLKIFEKRKEGETGRLSLAYLKSVAFFFFFFKGVE